MDKNTAALFEMHNSGVHCMLTKAPPPQKSQVRGIQRYVSGDREPLEGKGEGAQGPHPNFTPQLCSAAHASGLPTDYPNDLRRQRMACEGFGWRVFGGVLLKAWAAS